MQLRKTSSNINYQTCEHNFMKRVHNFQRIQTIR